MKTWIGIAGALASASALAGGPLAMQHPGMQAAGTLQVTSPSFRANAAVPARYSAYHDGISPALAWSRVDKAKSYALLVEDPDAPMATPFVHWVAWNIPSNATSLPEGLQGKAHAGGMVQGASGTGKPGYFGPRPPVADPPHHYHFEVFALDATLALPASADRDALVKAMQGHVLAKGELVGTYDELPPQGS